MKLILIVKRREEKYMESPPNDQGSFLVLGI
jgi:hypothetical protein